MHGGAQRCTEVCRGVRKGVQGGVQAMKGQVGKKAGPCRSAQVPRSCKLGKLVWWAHTQCSSQTFQQCTKRPQGTVWRCACVGGWHGGWFSGSWSKLGVWKKCYELNKILPMPMLILLFHNK